MFARGQVELGSVGVVWAGGYQLLGFLEVDGAAILGALLATHVLFGLDGGRAVDGRAVDHVHVDLGARADVVRGNAAGDLGLGLALLVLWYLDLR